ncbi:MAG: hypothetical protein WBW33_25695 [Bryobacteraceae bacterium]
MAEKNECNDRGPFTPAHEEPRRFYPILSSAGLAARATFSEEAISRLETTTLTARQLFYEMGRESLSTPLTVAHPQLPVCIRTQIIDPK